MGSGVLWILQGCNEFKIITTKREWLELFPYKNAIDDMPAHRMTVDLGLISAKNTEKNYHALRRLIVFEQQLLS